MNSPGILGRKPPNGTYAVIRMGSTVTGQEMPATPGDSPGMRIFRRFCLLIFDKIVLSVDLFNKEAIDAHFDTYLTRIINALKKYIPHTFYGLEINSYELGKALFTVYHPLYHLERH